MGNWGYHPSRWSFTLPETRTSKNWPVVNHFPNVGFVFWKTMSCRLPRTNQHITPKEAYSSFVVSTRLKNISQNGNVPQIGVKIKNLWNHRLVVSSLKSSLEALSVFVRVLRCSKDVWNEKLWPENVKRALCFYSTHDSKIYPPWN